MACAVLFPFRVGAVEPSNAGAASAAKGENSREDSTGPTIKLSYTRSTLEKNPITSFMYFVPLISLTLVDRQTSANNAQEVGVVSYERKIRGRSFQVVCEFEIQGVGLHKNTFEPTGLIAAFTGDMKKNETLTSMLDYINIEGAGFGRIEVNGTINGSAATVTGVNLRFNAKGRKSPVTMGLYDIEPIDGLYTYENRSNEVVVRVNTLEFKKGGRNPTMEIGVASIGKSKAVDGFLARIKGAIANLFITPPAINELGNDTMLNLGYALLKQELEFTFPKAINLQEDKIINTSQSER